MPAKKAKLDKAIRSYKNLKKKLSFLKWADPFTYVDLFIIEKYGIKNPVTQWIIYIVSAFVFAWIIYTSLGLALGTDTPMVVVVSDSMVPVMHRGDVIIVKGLAPEQVQAPSITFSSSLGGDPPQPFSNFGEAYNVGGQLKEIILWDNDTAHRLPYTKHGDVIVYDTRLYNIKARQDLFLPQPKPVRIIHRAITKINASDGVFLLTKGDSPKSNTIDQDCGQLSAQGTQKPCISVFPVQAQKIHGKAIARIPWIGYIKLLLTEPFTTH